MTERKDLWKKGEKDLWRNVTWGVRREKEEKHAVNSGHYVLPATPKGGAHNSLGPIHFADKYTY